ncbi:hypothetical protein Avbf_01033 [Armadillidium vulgare]|nr:hypothetical protein Avbf_01033 [Armadillidium vulgare]
MHIATLNIDQRSSETGYHHHHHGGEEEVEGREEGRGGGGVGGAGGRDHSKGAKYFMYAHQPIKRVTNSATREATIITSLKDTKRPDQNITLRPNFLIFKIFVFLCLRHDAHGVMENNTGIITMLHHTDIMKTITDYSHQHGSDEGHHHGYGHGVGHHSEPVPSIIGAESSTSFKQSPDERYKQSKLYKRSGYNKKPTDILKKKSKSKPKDESDYDDDVAEVPSAFPAVLGFDPYVPPKIAEPRKTSSTSQDRENAYPPLANQKKNTHFGRRGNNRSYESKKKTNAPKLAYDLDSGKVYDETTGKWFKLVQV